MILKETILLSVLYVVPILVSFYVAVEIFSRNPSRRDHQLAAAHQLLMGLLFFEELIRHFLPLSYTPMLVVQGLGNMAALLPSLSLHFILRITKLGERMPKWLYPYVLYITLIPITLTIFTGNVYNSSQFIQDGMWKVQVPDATYYVSITIGCFICLLFTLLLRIGIRRATSEEQKRLLRALTYSGLFELVWHIIFGYINFGGSLPPYPYLWGTFIWGLMLRYTMLRYDFLSSATERFKTLYMISPAAILLLDEHAVIQEANPTAQKLLKTNHLKSRSLSDFSTHTQRKWFLKRYKENFQDNYKLQDYELTIVNEEGEERIVLISSDYIFLEGQSLSMAIMQDITELKQAEEKVRFLAYHDQLTGLPNRYYFYEHAEKLVAAKKGKMVGVILLDLDEFKPVNDTYGHHVGDAFLVHVASLLQKCTETKGFASRLAGDEFVLFVEDTDKEDLQRYVQRLTEILQQSPFFWRDIELPVRASIGASLYTEPSTNIEVLIQGADTAMYERKRERKSSRILH